MPFQIDANLKEHDFGFLEDALVPLKVFEDNYGDCEDTGVFSRYVAKALLNCHHNRMLLVGHNRVVRIVKGLFGVEL